MESGDWRSQLTDISRNRIVNKITDILKRYIPISGPEAEAEGLQELRKIALKFEQKIYTSPTTANQNDYLRKIALKMKVMETISQNPMPDAMHSNPGANSVNPSDPEIPHNPNTQIGMIQLCLQAYIFLPFNFWLSSL
ncbi:mediator of RNA polymerase II transcription subunit 15a isoform X1 [Lactuca sativa]|uniref:mediator of RNA polymerase II transcription subunit 15a isoform X1 n=1 Tax=Lactuca sativa TaxID=4236 RepID=UPI000CD94553|nr:mediator of RNA polymerase II transcription subunit 15a isoform X1 [Lactuca sativa]